MTKEQDISRLKGLASLTPGHDYAVNGDATYHNQVILARGLIAILEKLETIVTEGSS